MLILLLLKATSVLSKENMAPEFQLPVINPNTSIAQLNNHQTTALEGTVDHSSVSTQPIRALSDYRGKVVYLAFWVSWCRECRRELPMLNKLRQNAYSNNGDEPAWEILVISVDANPDDARAFVRKHKIALTMLSDPIGKTSRLFRISGFPTGFLINKDGTIVSMTQGFQPGLIPTLEKAFSILAD